MPRKSLAGTKPPSTPEEAFGLVVRQRREELGLLQADLEGDAEMDRSYVSKLERGLQQPRLRAIIHLERVLQLMPGELVRRVRDLIE